MEGPFLVPEGYRKNTGEDVVKSSRGGQSSALPDAAFAIAGACAGASVFVLVRRIGLGAVGWRTTLL